MAWNGDSDGVFEEHGQVAKAWGDELSPTGQSSTGARPSGSDILARLARAKQESQLVTQQESQRVSLRVAQFALMASLVILTFFFGGAHPLTYLSIHTVLFAVTVMVLVSDWIRPTLSAETRLTTFDKLFFSGAALLTGYSFLQRALFALRPVDHPILGSMSSMADAGAQILALRDLAFFCSAYYLVRRTVGTSQRRLHAMRVFLIRLGVVVGLVALAHWFTDNGKLFWVFAPDSLYVSERARWPFVNPNHLAAFLLPLFFLIVGRVVSANFALLNSLRPMRLKGKRSISIFLVDRGPQRGLLRVLFGGVLGIVLVIAILATLSRGSCFGLAMGIVLFSLLRKPIRDRGISEEQETQLKAYGIRASNRGRSRSSSPEKVLSLPRIMRTIEWMRIPLILLLCAVPLAFFLSGRGAELLESRLDYALLYSMDDIRWRFYADTVKMVQEHLFLGVGLGNWGESYWQYMDPLLSGTNPVYLHSDPLQLLAELGLIGALVPLVGAGLLVVSTVRALRVLQLNLALGLLATFSGIATLVIASCFDFPFRIASIQLLAALLLAMNGTYIEMARDELHKRDMQ